MIESAYNITGSTDQIHGLDEQISLLCAQAPQLDEESYGIRLAVCEALSTVVEHAYDGADDCSIDVSLLVTEGKVEINIVDHGLSLGSLNIDGDVEGILGTEQASRLPNSGWGIYLMQTYMDDVRYEAREDVNVWTLVKEVRAN